GVEGRSQLFLSDRVRAGIRTLVTEAQYIQCSTVVGNRRQARHVSCSLVEVIEGVEQSAVQHRPKLSPETLQLQCVRRSELNVHPTVFDFLSGDCQRGFSHVNTQKRQPQRGDVKSILAGSAAGIEHRSGKSACGCQTHYCWLRPANIPGCRTVVVR